MKRSIKKPMLRPSMPFLGRHQTRKGKAAVQHPTQRFSTISNKEFDEFYHDVLAPQLNELEPIRKRSYVSGLITKPLSIPLPIIWLIPSSVLMIYEIARLPVPSTSNSTLVGLLTIGWILFTGGLVWIDSRFLQLEAQQKKNYKMALIMVGVAYTLFGVAFYWQTGSAMISILLVLVGVALTFFSLYQYSKEYVTLYKRQIIPQLLELMRVDLTYTAQPELSRQLLLQSKLFTEAFTIDAEDGISGIINGVTYNIAEISAIRRRSKSKAGIVFDGLFCTATLSEKFNGWLRIYPKRKIMGNGSWLGNWHAAAQYENFESSDRIFIGDKEFELCFRVYGSHPQAVCRILSPKLISRLLDLHRITPRVTMAISGNMIYLAIWDSKNYFEPHIKQSAANYTAVQNLVIELETIISVIDYLNVQQN